MTGDIDRAWEALDGAARPRIHVFLATSDLHLEHKLRIDRATCLARTREAVRYARERTSDVEFSAEDATRSDLDFLCEVAEVAVKAGATTVNLPDTVGYALPADITRMFTASGPAWATRSRCRRTATTTWGWPWPIPWPQSRPAPARWNAPSTASASGPATRRSRRS